MLQIGHSAQKARHFIPAQHNGELFCLPAGGDVVLDDPGPFEGDGVDKPERGDRDDDRTGREASFSRQMQQICPDLSRSETFRRLTKMAGEPDDLRNIHALRIRCQVADLHVLDHATAKRAHRQLL